MREGRSVIVHAWLKDDVPHEVEERMVKTLEQILAESVRDWHYMWGDFVAGVPTVRIR